MHGGFPAGRWSDDMPEQRKRNFATVSNLLSELPFSMVLTDPNQDDNPIVYVNHAFEEMTGYSATAAIGRNCRFLQGEDREQRGVDLLRDALARQEPVNVDLKNYRATGEMFVNRLLVAPIRDHEGNVFAFMGVQTEIPSSPDLVADELHKALQETHHRVKNHLQMISSLIRLQSRAPNPEETFQLLARRVETLSLLYDEFTSAAAVGAPSSDIVPAGGYVSRVCSAVGSLDGRTGIRFNVDTDDIEMDAGAASKIGLLTSEVLSNTFQHAFKGRDEGLVEVRFKRMAKDRLRLQISDDGVGFGESNWPQEGNLGAKIVRSLVAQLGAELNVSSSDTGTVIIVDLTYELPETAATSS